MLFPNQVGRLCERGMNTINGENFKSRRRRSPTSSRMARASIRDFLRFRNPILLHHCPTLVSSKPNTISYFSSSATTIATQSLYHRFIPLLEQCQCRANLFQIQTQLITLGILQNPSLASRILNLSINYCDMDHTSSIFRSIDYPDSYCVNNVIKAYACSSVPKEAVGVYFEMLQNGFVPNSFTFTSIFSASAKLRCLALGKNFHGLAVKNGVDGVLQVQNSLIHMYSCCGLIDHARNVFVKMSSKDLVSWNLIVDGFIKVGDLGFAHRLFDVMPSRNVVSWNIMISGYLDAKNPGIGLKLFRNMMKTDVKGNDTTFVSVLSACGRSARLKEGKSVHAALIRAITNLSVIIGTTLIDMYSKCGRPDVGQIIFDRLLVRNLVCCNVMILGHCLHGNPKDGLSLYEKMVDRNRSDDGYNTQFGKGVLPDEITFVGVLCACVREGLLIEGGKHFSQMTDVFHVKPNFGHYWCMANLFATCGLAEKAVQILKDMPVNADMSSQSSLWAGILGASCFKGDVAAGERIAKALIEEDPLNDTYYALLLHVYAVAGQWEDVARVKDLMKERLVKLPGGSLLDLIEIVHNLKARDSYQ